MRKMISRQCVYCGSKITVRLSDVNRGWGLFCDKICKAKNQRLHHSTNKFDSIKIGQS